MIWLIAQAYFTRASKTPKKGFKIYLTASERNKIPTKFKQNCHQNISSSGQGTTDVDPSRGSYLVHPDLNSHFAGTFGSSDPTYPFIKVKNGSIKLCPIR
jgi:hypothetical protein